MVLQIRSPIKEIYFTGMSRFKKVMLLLRQLEIQSKRNCDCRVKCNVNLEKFNEAEVWYFPGTKQNLFSELSAQDSHLQSQFTSKAEGASLKING